LSTALAADAEAEIRKHAVETYPNECCGALIAEHGAIVEAYRLPNTTAEGARRRFFIGPNDHRLAEARARERRGELAGFYHSHPDHPARPSQTDLEAAWPNLTYIIVAVAQGTPADLKSWRLREDRSGFEEI
jgi:proteasome lid subunit RPN8/RPN11